MKKIEWNRRSTHGFTLVEMLAVMAIVFILCATLGIAIRKISQQMEIKAAQSEMENMRAVLEEYYEDYGCYPPRNMPTIGQTWGLVTALHEYYEGKFNYLYDSTGLYLYWIDPWDAEYEYTLIDGDPVLRSYGPIFKNYNDDLINR